MEPQAFHVVLTTYNSRTSKRMTRYRVRKGKPVHLNLQQEILLTSIIGDLIRENEYKCIAYNVCKDHVHMIIVCRKDELSAIMQKLKSISSKLLRRKCKEIDTLPRGYNPVEGCTPVEAIYNRKKLWSTKFYRAELDDWKLASQSTNPGYLYKSSHLENAINYIVRNRIKHGLPQSNELEEHINTFILSQEEAFGI